MAAATTGKATSQGGGPAATAAPSLSLPKGGGAIRGIGEKFAANPVTGSGSMTVPIATSPGRSGFGPKLNLAYDSAAGNGPFGFGWSLDLPVISRKTDKGLPRYADGEESDVFILSGSEDLVPVLKPDGNRHEDKTTVPGFVIHRYRPRVEGLFARIERWTRKSDGDVHWRAITKDNLLTLYGQDASSRIVDPEDPLRVFSWLICETRDDRGNAILYGYKAEDGVGVDLTRPCERNRGPAGDARRAANRYIKTIRYGNRTPLLNAAGRRPRFLSDLPATQVDGAGWMFEVVFDYGEHDPDAPRPKDTGPWPWRQDAFAAYRSGFEVRTGRLCRRVLMFHHIPDLPSGAKGYEGLVRSTDFTWSHQLDPASARNPVHTFLRAVTQTGHRRSGTGYERRSLPAVEFDYSLPIVQDTVEEVDPASLENLPVGVDGTAWRWTDLHGEGIPGVLSEQAQTWYYKRNLSPISDRPVELAPREVVARRPNASLSGRQAQFMDLAGDGLPDLVMLEGPTPGFFEHDEQEGWQNFRPFTDRLARALADPNVKFVDLNGDGHADVLVTEDDALVWHPSLGEAGFGPARRVAQALDEERGPRLTFADGNQSIYLADMSGDGLADLVRIRNGAVCYWPNLGYGRFGAKVTMDDAPWLDRPDQYDPRRLRLADIDGSGVTDLIYLHADGARLYFNQSGNGWSAAAPLRAFPRVDDVADVEVVDLLGNGTACLVWSSALPGDDRRPMRYVSLMGAMKPHLLVRTVNNLGAETRLTYASSIKFYLQDRRDGRPWITRLPFPVHVVERVVTHDHVSRNRFTSRYAYHHGYFDGEEREFRGFGMVEQWDSEELAALTPDGELPPADNLDPASNLPPVLTRTWYHTGVYLGREHVSDFFAGLLDANDKGEYYREPGLTDAQARALLLPDTTLPAGLSLDEERQACRALKGSMLRQEIYGLDGSASAKHPYTVAEQTFAVRLEQAQGGNRHAVFFAHPAEALTYHYERNPADPRIQHSLTLEVDAFGNVLKEAQVGYGRRQPDTTLPLPADRDRQAKILVTFSENRMTGPVDDEAAFPGAYRTPVQCEALGYELTGYVAGGPAGRYRPEDFVEPKVGGGWTMLFDEELAYEARPTTGRQRRPIEQARTLFRADDLSAILPLGRLEALALPGETYRLAFTPGLLSQVYSRSGSPLMPVVADVLTGPGGDRGGYVSSQQMKTAGRFPTTDADGHWWIPSGQTSLSPKPADTAAQELAYAQAHFFLTVRTRDPFHTTAVSTETLARWDAFDLLMVEVRDPLGNLTSVGERRADGTIDPARPGMDYRVLQPRLLTDPNRNRSEVAFDALGLVVGTATMGKAEESLGDSLAGFVEDLAESDILGYLDQPLSNPHAILGKASARLVYDLFAYQRTRTQPAPQPVVVATLTRETHDADLATGEKTRIQHGFDYSDGFSREIQRKVRAEAGPLVDAGPTVDPRWLGSGWVIFNNKGKAVRQYEPFFSATHRFEFGVQAGVSPILFHDPLERVVATLQPNHSYAKTVFGPWRQETWDVNDTVLDDPRTDPDTAGYMAAYFAGVPAGWQTWRAQRQAGGLGALEQAAAAKAALHARTPTIEHFDSLSRRFLTVADNGPDPANPGRKLLYCTRLEHDIEGNQRTVRDALDQAGDPLGRIVMRYAYDMLSEQIHQVSMEAGSRWMLQDVAGKPIRAWDSRGHQFRTGYDALRRPVRTFVTGADPGDPTKELLTERMVYGEQHGQGEARNLRGGMHLRLDQAGATLTERLDFKGNTLAAARRLTSGTQYRGAIDWSAVDADTVALPPDGVTPIDDTALAAALATVLEADSYAGATAYDALNRPVALTTPHTAAMAANVVRPEYNVAGLLERLDANLREEVGLDGKPLWTRFVSNIDYDAKRQRRRIDYGNGVTTTYDYDPLSFRLVHLLTRRDPAAFTDCPTPPPTGWPGCQAQNLRYTYDPVGNIVHVRDEAQQAIYFDNRRVEPSADYTYDALYRLIEATGREHLGQIPGPPIPHDQDDALRSRMANPRDGKSMGTYVERILYDAVGNILEMQHRGSDPFHAGWKRGYVYQETSQIEDGLAGALLKTGNRLSRTTLSGGTPATSPYLYDVHGNMVRMPHLGGAHPAPNMVWDERDQLRRSGLGGGGTAYYVYDSTGERVRKVWEKSASLVEERIYFAGFEIFRRRQGVDLLERETLQIMDDSRRIALVETRTVDTAGSDPAPARLIRYELGNHLGTASLELDDKGRVISYEEYSPFGSTTYQAVRDLTETPKRYRFTGKERDEETGLYYHGARYYVPWLGRWTRPDPLFLKDSVNVYVYALNNPIVASDPTGGPVWLIPVAIYLGYKALTSAAETAVETGIAKATDDKNFSVGWTFAKNMAVNSTIGLIPGTSEAKIGVKVAVYTGKLALRTAADATLDTAMGKGDFKTNVVKSAAGNVVGDGASVLLKKTGGKIVDAVSDRMTKKTVEKTAEQTAETTAKKATKEGGEQVAKESANKAAAAPTDKAVDKAVAKAAEKPASAATKKVVISEGTRTVWDHIKATQPNIDGTVVPKSFELATEHGSVWVSGNGSKHIGEYAMAILKRVSGRPAVVAEGVSAQGLANIGAQAQLTSLRAAVDKALAGGVAYDKIVNIGGWELKFGAPRAPGLLPALYHALEKPK